MTTSLAYATALFSSAGTSSSLLNIAYGYTGSSAGSSGQSPIAALQAAELNQAKDVKLTASQAEVKQAVAAFTKGVNSAKSVAQLLANPAVTKVLLSAAGLSDQAGYTALVTKVLTSNLSDPKSLANTLTDPRWKALAQTFNFAKSGLSAIQTPAAIANVANAYATQTWESSQDSVTPGLSNALAFKAKAGSITSVDQILGDATLRTVVTTALGIPQQIAFQPLKTQEQVISNHIDITRFKDPKFVETFVQRYLVANNTSG